MTIACLAKHKHGHQIKYRPNYFWHFYTPFSEIIRNSFDKIKRRNRKVFISLLFSNCLHKIATYHIPSLCLRVLVAKLLQIMFILLSCQISLHQPLIIPFPYNGLKTELSASTCMILNSTLILFLHSCSVSGGHGSAPHIPFWGFMIP